MRFGKKRVQRTKNWVRLTSKPESVAKYMLAKYRHLEESALQSIHAAYKTLKQFYIRKKDRLY